MTKLSVVVATYNEEANIARCLASVKDIAGEIIIIDAKSEDKTREIARKFKAKIYLADNQPIFHINKQTGLDKAAFHWILQLDADEEVTDQLKHEIIKTIEQNGNIINGYYLPRKNYFLGRWMKKGGLYPDYLIRLIRKGKAFFPCKSVHEQIQIIGKTEYLKSPILHYSYLTLSDYLRKAKRYTSLTAEDLKADKVKINFLSTLKYGIYFPVKTFISIFIRHQGFKDGLHGFIWAVLSSTHYFFAYGKLIKIKHYENSH